VNIEGSIPVLRCRADESSRAQTPFEAFVLGGVPGAVQVFDQDRFAEGQLVSGDRIGKRVGDRWDTGGQDQGARVKELDHSGSDS
jgi:hypothetical protein